MLEMHGELHDVVSVVTKVYVQRMLREREFDFPLSFKSPLRA